MMLSIQTALEPDPTARRATGTHPRILVVDDDPQFAEALGDTISELGWQTVRYTEAAAALRHVRGGGYDGLFVDVFMPGIGGLEVLRVSLARCPTTPVVVMSGQDVPRHFLQDVICRGPVIFLRKPMRRSDVRFALELFGGPPFPDGG